jgi:tetratricopeptide (TPR) repeat protein
MPFGAACWQSVAPLVLAAAFWPFAAAAEEPAASVPPANAATPTALPTTPEDVARAAYEKQPDNAWLGRTLLDLLVRNGKLDEARRLADALAVRFPDDAQLWAQTGYLLFMQRDFKQAQLAFARALRGTEWQPDQRRNLAFAEADSALAANDPASAVQALQKSGMEDDLTVRLRIGRAQVAAHDRISALATGRWLQTRATDIDMQEAVEALLKDAQEAVQDARGDKQLNLGYSYVRQGEDAKALEAFERGFAFGSGKAFHFADAAYSAKRSGDNVKANRYFRFALDLGEYEHSFSDARSYGYRREIEAMERRFGMLIGTPYHAGALDVWQGGVEAYWQPPVIGYIDGRTVQLFARAYLNFRNGIGGPIGPDTTQESIGIRFKPLVSQNISFTAERLFAVGRYAVNDWLFRIGYSAGDGGDLRVDTDEWRSWQVFGEAAYFVNGRRVLIGTELRYGWAIPWPNFRRLTIYPHLLMAVDYDSGAQDELVNAIGPGLSVRAWYGEDRYHAPPAFLELNAQYRWADAERGRGPALRATLAF